MSQLYGGIQDMQTMQREDTISAEEVRGKEMYRAALATVLDGSKSATALEVLEKEATETMHSIEETEKLLVNIVMRYLGTPPAEHPEGEKKEEPRGALNRLIELHRTMRVKLSVMRADVARLV